MGCAQGQLQHAPGKFHDNYHLGKKLGEGAFGQVRAAAPSANNSSSSKVAKGAIAVKIVDIRVREYNQPTNKRDEALLRVTQTEIKLWEALGQHNNVVQLKSHFFENGLFYMVMERCKCSLMTHFANLPSIVEADFLRVFVEMLLGLKHVHEARIVHRDIKLDNFLLGGPGNKTVKLCDFGLATSLPKKGLVEGVYGTAPYMSPEMLDGSGYTELTDVWSFGATAFLMLHGEFPYSPKSGNKSKPHTSAAGAAMKKAIMSDKPPIDFDRQGDGFFTPSFIGKATPFLQACLERNARVRRPVAEILNHTFLSLDCEEEGRPSFESTEAPGAIMRISKVSQEYQAPRNQIVQNNLDEIVQKLQQARHHAFDETRNFFSENEETEAKKEEQGPEVRIRRRSWTRHSTHSGVVDMQALMDLAVAEHNKKLQDRHESHDTGSTNTGGESARSNADDEASKVAVRKVKTAPEALDLSESSVGASSRPKPLDLDHIEVKSPAAKTTPGTPTPSPPAQERFSSHAVAVISPSMPAPRLKLVSPLSESLGA